MPELKELPKQISEKIQQGKAKLVARHKQFEVQTGPVEIPEEVEKLTIATSGIKTVDSKALETANLEMQKKPDEKGIASIVRTVWKRSLFNEYFHQRELLFSKEMQRALHGDRFSQEIIAQAKKTAQDRYRDELNKANGPLKTARKTLEFLKSAIGRKSAIQNYTLEELRKYASELENQQKEVVSNTMVREVQQMNLRFREAAQEADELIRSNEKLIILKETSAKEKGVIDKARKVMLDYVSDSITEDQFKTQSADVNREIRALDPKLMNAADVYTSTLFETGRALKALKGNKLTMEKINGLIMASEFRLGLGVMGAINRPEETIVDRFQKTALGAALFNEPVIATTVAGVIAIGTKAPSTVATNLARTAGGMVGGSVVGGAVAAGREYGRLGRERTGILREMELGHSKSKPGEAPNRAWIESTVYEMTPATKLTQDLKLPDQLTEENLPDLFKHLANAQAHIDMSNRTKNPVGLMSFTSEELVETERTNLHLAIRDAKHKLKTLDPNLVNKVTNNQTWEDFLKSKVDTRTGEIKNGMAEKDKQFEKERLRRAGAYGLKAAGAGLMVGGAVKVLQGVTEALASHAPVSEVKPTAATIDILTGHVKGMENLATMKGQGPWHVFQEQISTGGHVEHPNGTINLMKNLFRGYQENVTHNTNVEIVGKGVLSKAPKIIDYNAMPNNMVFHLREGFSKDHAPDYIQVIKDAYALHNGKLGDVAAFAKAHGASINEYKTILKDVWDTGPSATIPNAEKTTHILDFIEAKPVGIQQADQILEKLASTPSVVPSVALHPPLKGLGETVAATVPAATPIRPLEAPQHPEAESVYPEYPAYDEYVGYPTYPDYPQYESYYQQYPEHQESANISEPIPEDYANYIPFYEQAFEALHVSPEEQELLRKMTPEKRIIELAGKAHQDIDLTQSYEEQVATLAAFLNVPPIAVVVPERPIPEFTPQPIHEVASPLELESYLENQFAPSFVKEAERFQKEEKHSKLKGFIALLKTNETTPNGFVERIKTSPHPPNGYIVGAGIGNIFSMLDLFEKDKPPKGLISLDVNPNVTLRAKLLRHCFKQNTTFDGFQKQYFPSTQEEFTQLVTNMIAQEHNPQVQQALRTLMENPNRQFALQQQTAREENVTDIIRRHYTALHEMSVHEKFSVLYANLADPNFQTQLTGLPQWNQSNNVLYLSNVIDHVTHRFRNLRLAHVWDQLEKIQPTETGKKNHYVYTFEFAHVNYKLLTSTDAPTIPEVQRHGVASFKGKLSQRARSDVIRRAISNSQTEQKRVQRFHLPPEKPLLPTLEQPARRMYEISRDMYGPLLIHAADRVIDQLKSSPNDSLVMCVGRDSLPLFITLQKTLELSDDSQLRSLMKQIKYVPASRTSLVGALSPQEHARLFQQIPTGKSVDYTKPSANFQENRRDINEYLTRIGFDQTKHIILADIGVRGTGQNVLKMLYPQKNIKGIYVSANPPKNDPEKHNKISIVQQRFNPRAIQVVEDLWNGLFGSTKQFERRGGALRAHQGYETFRGPRLSQQLQSLPARLLVKRVALLGIVDAVRAKKFAETFTIPQESLWVSEARLRQWVESTKQANGNPIDKELINSLVRPETPPKPSTKTVATTITPTGPTQPETRPAPTPNEIRQRGERIHMDESLPREYQNVLDELNLSVPSEFKEQARQSAYYFWSLNEDKQLSDVHGNSLQDTVNRFADQLASTGFVWHTYHEAESDKIFAKTHPELMAKQGGPTVVQEALPEWIYTRMEKLLARPHLTKDELDTIAKAYEDYGKNHGVSAVYGVQDYYDFVNGVPPRRSPRFFGKSDNFKAYIEDDIGKFPSVGTQAMEALRQQGIHPQQTKLSEGDRLVLYWGVPPNESLYSNIEQMFRKFGIGIRGPGQDPFSIILTKDGKYNVELTYSNDASLGEGSGNSIKWKEKHYDAQKFFRRYLEMTFHGRKNPENPYKISFIPIVVRDMPPSEERTKLVEMLEQKVQDTDRLPIIISDHQYLEAFSRLDYQGTQQIIPPPITETVASTPEQPKLQPRVESKEPRSFVDKLNERLVKATRNETAIAVSPTGLMRYLQSIDFEKGSKLTGGQARIENNRLVISEATVKSPTGNIGFSGSFINSPQGIQLDRQSLNLKLSGLLQFAKGRIENTLANLMPAINEEITKHINPAWAVDRTTIQGSNLRMHFKKK